MTHKDLIYLLEQLDPNDELCIEVTHIASNKTIAITYDMMPELNACNELKLCIAIER